MSILNTLAKGGTIVEESTEPEFVSEQDMSNLMAIVLEETCTDEELEELKEAFTNGVIQFTPVEERSIVKLDKKAKKEKAYRLALYQVAKENNDKNYEKLVTLWKAEKILEQKIERRWHTKAQARMKEMIKQSSQSKSPTVKKSGDILTKSQKKTQRALNGSVKMDSKTTAKTNAILNKLRVAT